MSNLVLAPCYVLSLVELDIFPQGPHSHILMTGGGGGPKDFFESDILAKSVFLGSMKDAGNFLGHKNNTGIFLGIFQKVNNKIC